MAEKADAIGSIASGSSGGGSKSSPPPAAVSNRPLPQATGRPCRYYAEGHSLVRHLDTLLTRLECKLYQETSANNVYNNTSESDAVVDVHNLKILPQLSQQPIYLYLTETIDDARWKVARVKKLLYFDDHTSPLSKATAAGAEANQSKGGEKLVTLYGDHLESVQNTLNPSEELLYCQLLQSHRKRASESPLPWTAIYSGKNSNSSLTEPVPSTSFAKPVPPPLFSLPSNATPKQIFSLLASLEEEHFRAGLFELAVLDAVKALTVKENGTVDEDLRHRFYSKLAVFSRHIDEVQIADVEAAFNAAFTGLCETVTDFGSTSGQSAQVDRPPEIVDYLVALAALLTATSQLRPAAADVLRSLFTSSVDQLVLYTAGQLSLLSSDLLSPSSNNYLSYENENYYHKYRSVVDGTLLLLRRIFSHRCIPSLGAKVGVKALCALLTTFLPFYVLQNGLVYHHAALYQPIVAFAERRLFLGLSEEEDEVQAAATVAAISSFSSSSSSSSSSTMFSPALTKALIAYYVGYQEHWGNTSTKLKKEKEAITGENNDGSYRPTIFEEISKKLKDFSKSTEKLHFLHGFISVVVDETVKERQQMEQKEENVAPCPPVNCTALLTALLRLLVRLTTEPVAVMAEVLMVPPSALEDGSAAQQISLSNFRLLNTNFNLFSVRETRSTAKWLLSTFWSKAQALLQIMDKNGLDVYGTIQQENTDFQGTLEELLKQLHLLFENYSDPHDTEHLDAKIVELGNDTAGQVLNFLVNNLGTFIWSYFRLVDEELEKMASKSGLYGQHKGQFSVMSAYLSSLDLERPGVVVEMKKEKKLSLSGLIMDFDDDEEGNDDAFGGSEEAQEDYYTGGGKSEKEVQFVDALHGVAELDNTLGSASIQGSSSSAAPVALGNSSTLKSTTTPEDALSKFSSLMLDKTSQMLKNVEVFVRDLALAEKNLKDELKLTAESLSSSSTSEELSVDDDPADSEKVAAPEQSISASSSSTTPCCSPSISVAVEDVALFTTNSNGKRSREEEMQQQEQKQQLQQNKTSKKPTEIISVGSGDDEVQSEKVNHTDQDVVSCEPTLKATPLICISASTSATKKICPPPLSLSSQNMGFSLDNAEMASAEPSTVLTTTITPVIEGDNNGDGNGDGNGDENGEESDDSTSAGVLQELQELQRKMTSYEQTIALLLEKLDSKMNNEQSSSSSST